MGAVEITTVGDRRAARAWVDLPHRIYADDDCWTPPLRADELRRARDRLTPAGVTTQRFLAWSGKEAVGRIEVSDEPDGDRTETALLTGYEAVADPGVAAALLDASADWARERGRRRLAGPRGRLLFGMTTGLQISGFDRPAPVGTPHHRPYYRHHWEDVMGMTQTGALVNLAMQMRDFEMPPVAAEVEASVADAGYSIVRFRSFDDIARQGDAVRRITNVALDGLPNWLPLHEADLPVMVDRMRRIATRPDLFTSLHFEGRMVGYMVAHPEVGAAVRRGRGRLLPTGWLRVLRERHRTDTVTFLAAAILPDHQGRGAALLMSICLARTLVDDPRIRNVEFVLGDIENDRSLGLVIGMSGARETARFAVYERSIA